MPKWLYPSLVSAPFRITGALVSGVGAAGTLFPDWISENVVPRMTGEAVQHIGIAMLILAVAYFAALWMLKPGAPDTSAPASQPRTHGSQSPIINTVHGGVHFGPPKPPMAQEREHAVIPDSYSLHALDGVRGHILDGGDAKGEPRPDLPLTGVLVRVYKAMGGLPDNATDEAKFQFGRKVDLEIADRVVLDNLTTWGRSAPPARHRADSV